MEYPTTYHVLSYECAWKKLGIFAMNDIGISVSICNGSAKMQNLAHSFGNFRVAGSSSWGMGEREVF